MFDRECMVAFCVRRLAVPISCATGSADDLEVIGDPWQFSEVSLSVLGGALPFQCSTPATVHSILIKKKQ